MSTPDGETLGARIRAATTGDRFALHQAEGDRSGFDAFDRVVGGVIDRLVRGKQVLDFTPAPTRTASDRLEIRSLDHDERVTLVTRLGRESHQQHGAWYLPEQERFTLGIPEFAYWTSRAPKFAISAADAQRGLLKLDCVDATLIWAVSPLMESLFLPFKVRSGFWLGARRPDQMAAAWAEIETTYASLGIDPGVVDAFRDGKRFASLSTDELVATRQTITAAWAVAPANLGDRAIALMINALVGRYYAKAKSGRALRAKVVNKAMERYLTAAFGGDWLAFLRYIGEQPHPAEEIATAVAPTSLLATDEGRAANVAAATGVAVEEIERVLSTFWGGTAASPVERRVDVMRNWWKAFDAAHARQAPGMPPLISFVGTAFEDTRPANDSGTPRVPLYESILPAELRADIEELWGSCVLPRWPNVLVSQPYPHAELAETFGVAVRFWHEVALTCWFICEGPYAMSDIGGLPNRYDRELKELGELGFRIDNALWGDLRAAEKRLTERPIEPKHVHEVGRGDIRFTVSMTVGSPKKDGFEYLRDVLTRYRRVWATAHLEPYLRARWDRELRATGDAYHRAAADKGKAPTPRQFADLASESANHWFGGDLSDLAGALQLPASGPQERRRLLPPDRAAFVADLRRVLGGKRWGDSDDVEDRDERTKLLRRSELAERSPKVVQTWEAIGARPPLRGQNWARYLLEATFGSDDEAAWNTYLDAIESAISRAQPSVQQPERARQVEVVTAEPTIARRGTESPPSANADQPDRGVRGLLRRFRGQ